MVMPLSHLLIAVQFYSWTFGLIFGLISDILASAAKSNVIDTSISVLAFWGKSKGAAAIFVQPTAMVDSGLYSEFP